MSAAAAPTNGGPRPARRVELDSAGGPPATVLVRGARLLDPRSGLNGVSDVLVRDGRIAEISATLDAPDGAEVVEAEGLHAFPAFVDPHVHLRTPGREDEEDIDSGTRAAAAGGFCAILAQPNTEPVVDSAPVLRSLRERARAEARIPTGFMAAITVGQDGERLTEMAELADAGAAGFTDDGLPVRSAGVMRQALQYQRLAGRVLALHEEDPSLSGGRGDARGRDVGAARRGGDPVGVRVVDGRARLRPRAVRGGAHPRAARVGARDASRRSSGRRRPAAR